jgi:hypothetical protein
MLIPFVQVIGGGVLRVVNATVAQWGGRGFGVPGYEAGGPLQRVFSFVTANSK